MLKKIYFTAFLVLFGLYSAQNKKSVDPISYPDIRNENNIQSQTPTFNKAVGEKRLSTNGSNKSDPLFIINGEVATAAEFHKVKPDTIESVHVLKDKSATDLYGESAKYGAIIIALKNS